MSKKANAQRFDINSFHRIMVHRLMTALEWLDRFLQHPQQPRTCHQLRVSLRQSRSLLSFMRPAIKGKGLTQMQQDLRAIAHQLALLREIDVLLEALENFGLQQTAVPGLEELKIEVLKARQTEQESVYALMASPKVRQTLIKALKRADNWLEPGKPPSLFKPAAKRAEDWKNAIREGMTTIDPEDLEACHRLRITIKKLRYGLENLPMDKADSGFETKRLKTLQDELGIICDTHVHPQVLNRLDIEMDDDIKSARNSFFQHLKQERAQVAARLQSMDIT